MILTTARKRTYFQEQGKICPFCGSIHIVQNPPKMTPYGSMKATSSCEECNKTWAVIYTLEEAS